MRDCRLPISLSLLHKLCLTVKRLFTASYQQTMFQSMYRLAFFAFLRVGEFTLSHGRSENILQLQQINFQPDGNSMLITFSKYKHSKGKTHTIAVLSRSGPFCPLSSLIIYHIRMDKQWTGQSAGKFLLVS